MNRTCRVVAATRAGKGFGHSFTLLLWRQGAVARHGNDAAKVKGENMGYSHPRLVFIDEKGNVCDINSILGLPMSELKIRVDTKQGVRDILVDEEGQLIDPEAEDDG